MSYTEPTGFGDLPPKPALVDDAEARVLDCFARSSSEWLRVEDLWYWAGCDQGVLDDLVELGKLEPLNPPVEDEAAVGAPWWSQQYRMVAPEPQPPRRRMKFAVGHPNDIGMADFSACGISHSELESIWWSLELFSYGEIPGWVQGDPPVLVAAQDPRALDAMAPHDWKDLQARIVLVRPGGALAALKDTEAQDIMEEYEARQQSLSELIHQRVALSDDA